MKNYVILTLISLLIIVANIITVFLGLVFTRIIPGTGESNYFKGSWSDNSHTDQL